MNLLYNFYLHACFLNFTEEKIPHMTHQEEAYLLQQVNKSALNSAPPEVRRLYRKLAVRKLKREYGLPVLDIDNFGFKSEIPDKPLKDSGRVLDRFFGDDLGSFEQRLQGYNEPTSVHSPYTNRLLKPFIRRDTWCRPLWLRIMEELRSKVNKCNPKWKPPPSAPIDYSYVRPQHIPAINSLCSQFFWPGIDCKYIRQLHNYSVYNHLHLFLYLNVHCTLRSGGYMKMIMTYRFSDRMLAVPRLQLRSSVQKVSYRICHSGS